MVRVRVFTRDGMPGRGSAAKANLFPPLIESSGGIFLLFALFSAVVVVAGRRRKIRQPENHAEGTESGASSSGAKRKPRSYSRGDYGKPPPLDKIPSISVAGGHVLIPRATRTLTTIMRIHWPVGSFTYRQAMLNTEGKFLDTVLKEFRRYYKNEDGTSESQWNKDVAIHVETRMRGLKSEAKKEAFQRATQYKTSIVDQRPEYFSQEVWTSMCAHFLGEDHASKSETNKQNRSKKEIVHGTGSTSHAKIKKDLTEKKGECPTRLELFEATHTRKGTQNFISDKARNIAERYKEILNDRLQTLKDQEKEPIEWWIEAAGPIKKNRILGEPRISATTLLTGANCENHAPTQTTCGGCPANDLFFKVVDETLQSAKSTALFKEALVSREQVQTLAEDVVASGGISNLENSTLNENKEEVICLVVSTLESIYSKIQQSLKGAQNDGQGTATTSSCSTDDSAL